MTRQFTFDPGQRWRTAEGPTDNLDLITYEYTGTGRLKSYHQEPTPEAPEVQAAYSYDSVGQRTRSVVTIGEGESQVLTSTDFTYAGLALQRLEATQTGGLHPGTWSLTYLYDEYGKPYAGVYRSPQTSTTPTVFTLITSDRGDVLALLDAEGSPFAAYRYDAWGNPLGEGTHAPGLWAQETSLVSGTLAAEIAGRQVLRYAGYCFDSESGPLLPLRPALRPSHQAVPLEGSLSQRRGAERVWVLSGEPGGAHRSQRSCDR